MSTVTEIGGTQNKSAPNDKRDPTSVSDKLKQYFEQLLEGEEEEKEAVAATNNALYFMNHLSGPLVSDKISAASMPIEGQTAVNSTTGEHREVVTTGAAATNHVLSFNLESGPLAGAQVSFVIVNNRPRKVTVRTISLEQNSQFEQCQGVLKSAMDLLGVELTHELHSE